jgi:hypothetical protein
MLEKDAKNYTSEEAKKYYHGALKEIEIKVLDLHKEKKA